MIRFNRLFTAILLSCMMTASFTLAQITISGDVKEKSTGVVLVGVSIQVKGKVIGTITNNDGYFNLTVQTPPPLVLVISSVGFQTQELTVTDDRRDIRIEMVEEVMMGKEVVVSASRVEESVMQSPVTVERIDIRTIRESPAPTFFEALRNIKGVEMSTQSLTFSNPNTRGFSGNGNLRMVQLVDGMDNQAPGLNFSVANIAGLSELDVESVELLPGASSALYGPNALNGILLMTSKSPFLYQGLSAYLKTGVMDAANRVKRYSDTPERTTPFYDVGVRYAKAFRNKFAFKVNFTYLKAKDWQATDYRDQSLSNGSGLDGTRETNFGYDGVNMYGDPSVNLNSTIRSALVGVPALKPLNDGLTQLTSLFGPLVGLTPAQAYSKVLNDLYPGISIGRTGYRERDLVDYNAYSVKTNASLHYRITEGVEALLQGNWGLGTTVYTGADRYYIKNFTIGQYKAELKGSNFFIRAYTTRENSGDTYAAGIAGFGMNKQWTVQNGVVVPDPTYFGTYAATYAGATLPGVLQAIQTAAAGGASSNELLQIYQNSVISVNSGRNAALTAIGNSLNNGRLLIPGTPEFEAALKTVTEKPIPGDAAGVGAKFLDKTNLYHFEGMYNFKTLIDPKFVEVVAGLNYRIFDLNSNGTIFYTRPDGSEPSIKEYGGYVQLQKTIANILRLSGSIRYDKNENFEGQFSPRISGVLTLNKDHNIRASFQTGFRIPDTQAQYIDLLTPTSRLIGALQPLRDKYFAGQNVINFFTRQPYQFTEFKPERVISTEFGYKGLIANRLFVDAYYYNSRYKDFITGAILEVTEGANKGIYSMSSNYSADDIRSQGFGVGADYSLPGNFLLGANVSNNTLNAGGVGLFSGEMNRNMLDNGEQINFNTPKYRYSFTFGNRNIARSGWGFNVIFRKQDAFIWSSSFVSATVRGATDPAKQSIIPSISTVDAQISRKLRTLKSIVKLGGTNIGSKLYQTSWGNPSIGGMYYISFVFDQLSN